MSAWRMGRLRLAGIALVGCLTLGLTGATSALAETVTFKYTGKEQEFKVPAGVTSVHVVANGAGGAKGESEKGAESLPGLPAIVEANLSVTEGSTLYVEVGGLPTGGAPTCVNNEVHCLGGFNGGGSSRFGGGGGGASDIRMKSRTEAGTLESRLLVAAGGGGGGELCVGPPGQAGGRGGSAEEPGGEGGNCGLSGGEGGGAGKEAKGGAGGSEFGEEGKLGTGGNGGLGTGGGGGGGLYGGGGGGAFRGEEEDEGAAGGGGGGSNLLPKGGTFVGTAKDEAGSVTITYTLPTQTCGKTTVGKTGDPLVANVKRVNKCVVPFNASVRELTVYLSPTSFKGQELIKGVIYADNKGKPGALLGVSEQRTFKSTEAANWYPLRFESPVSVAAGTYWIGLITGNTGKVAGERWDTVKNAEDYNSNTYTSGPSNPFGSFKTTNEEMSLYATFTPACQVPGPFAVPCA